MELRGLKTLFLLRHAKSSWADEDLADIERPLKERGRKAAATIGRFLRKERVNPDLVLSSCAVRARETIDIVLKAAKLRTEIRYDERIYEASPLRLLEVILQIDSDRKSVLLVGHNPGMEELLQLLTGNVEHMPTAALAKIALKTSKWSGVGARKGTLEWFVKPKELQDI
jgi:phosphohistidine phosphatase